MMAPVELDLPQPLDPAAATFLCDAISAAAPLVEQLHDLALDWAGMAKGRAMTYEEAIDSVCTFPGSPCPLFRQPRVLLDHLAAAVRARERPHLLLAGDEDSGALLRHLQDQKWRVTTLLSSNGSSPSSARGPSVWPEALRAVEKVHVLLARRTPSASATHELEHLLRAVQPSLAILLPPQGEAAAQWATSELEERVLRHGYSTFAAAAAVDGARDAAGVGRQLRRRGRKAKGKTKAADRLALATAAARASARARRVVLLWRSTGCERPLWDLRRPLGSVTAAERAAATAAVRAGVRYSEWFACSTLEPVRAMVRVLFAGSRSKGKSVWGACMRPNSPSLWMTGNHTSGEGFVHQVLSSPDVALSRLSAHWAAALPAMTRDAAPLFLLDPAAGEGNYTQHLPDGMGKLPTLQLVRTWAWHALLAEPATPTFEKLASNFAGFSPPAVRLARTGLTAGARRVNGSLWVLSASLPSLAATVKDGLPADSRMRLQYATSTDRNVPDRLSGDLWQMNHLVGGPMIDALRAAGHAEEAARFAKCKDASATLKKRCYGVQLREYRAELLPFAEMLREHGVTAVDLLVLDVWDGSTGPLLLSFPLHAIKPSIIYYRNPYTRREAGALRRHLLAHGYSTSAHWETGAWGELNIAWRKAQPCARRGAAVCPPCHRSLLSSRPVSPPSRRRSDRCEAPGMPGRPLWAAG